MGPVSQRRRKGSVVRVRLLPSAEFSISRLDAKERVFQRGRSAGASFLPADVAGPPAVAEDGRENSLFLPGERRAVTSYVR